MSKDQARAHLERITMDIECSLDEQQIRRLMERAAEIYDRYLREDYDDR